ncbi:alpha/beta-hydrolase [Peniophora sp. CONT]|nr:alpha/beta-hydrolase [Peniophora sp. CONT]
MRVQLLPLLSLASTNVFASPLAAPLVDLEIGPFRGLTENNTDIFLGIPFAQPPVGRLRFLPPQPIITKTNAVRDATQFGNACPQPPDLNGLGAEISEDCLFLNVWRPEGTKEGDDLPMLLYIHGGMYAVGASSSPGADGKHIVGRSVEIGKPIIFVSINYRVNTFGFLASKHVPVQNLNVGLQDQSAALKFLQKNLRSFGGDPEKVTIWGQSAGAGSVASQIIYGPPGLFRAGIMNSDTGPFKNSPGPSTYDLPGKPFDVIAREVGCTPGPSAFECLQDTPFDILVNVSNAHVAETLNEQFWEPTVAPGSFVPVRASTKIAAGDFMNVPMIVGTNLNEGTGFSTSLRNLNLTGPAQLAAFDGFVRASVIDPSKITSDVLTRIHQLYPASPPSLPHSTGDELFDRAAAWYGDNMFLAARRRFVDSASKKTDVFAYHFRELIPGNDPSLGVFHSSELALLFEPTSGVDSVEQDFANEYLDLYINFVSDLNPGESWPRFTSEHKIVLQLKRDNITAIPDDFRTEFTTFENSPEVLDEWEK